MRMKRILTAVALFMAILTVGSSAWANTYADHVSVAPNGQGDLLVYPIFVSTDGWSNRVTLVNSSSTHSVVAKLVVRSAVYSQELVDFLIYLSPNDYWYGFIQYTTATGPVLHSTDSSVLYDSGINYYDIPEPFATATNPMNAKFAPSNCTADINTLGYIEVIEAWAGVVPFTTAEKADKQVRGKKIAEYYDNAAFGAKATINVLSGSIDIDVETQGLSMTTSVAALAFKNYGNINYLTNKSGTVLGKLALNNIREIDAVLSKNNLVMPYINNDEGTTLHTFTFPTKQSATTTTCVYAGSVSDYFTGQKVAYTPTVYDNDERKADNPFSPSKAYVLPNEFSFTDVSTIVFKQGWIRYFFSATAPAGANLSGQVLNYTGAPVIPMVLDFRAGFSLKAPAFEDGVVSGVIAGLPVVFDNYQYSSSYSVS